MLNLPLYTHTLPLPVYSRALPRVEDTKATPPGAPSRSPADRRRVDKALWRKTGCVRPHKHKLTIRSVKLGEDVKKTLYWNDPGPQGGALF